MRQGKEGVQGGLGESGTFLFWGMGLFCGGGKVVKEEWASFAQMYRSGADFWGVVYIGERGYLYMEVGGPQG